MIQLRRLVPTGMALLLAGCTETPTSLSPPGSASAKSAPGTPGSSPVAGMVPRGQLRELLEEAKKSANSGNLAGSAALFEEVLKLEPTHREALRSLAMLNQDRALSLERPRSSAPFLRSASAMRQLRSAYKTLTDEEAELFRLALFYEARTYAVDDKPEKALDSLAEAIDAGFLGLEPLHTDPELAPLRKLPRFKALEAKLEGRARTLAQGEAKDKLAKNQPFPFSFKLPGVDGKALSSDDLRGKVVVVDFWGTWCPPCRKEIPHLVALASRYKDKGLNVVGLNYEKVPENEVKQAIADFVRIFEVSYPCLIGDEKTMAQIPGFVGFPTTLILDRSGKVRARMDGFDPNDSVGILAMEELVTTLLAE